jgi:anti-sigma-K factor RskA
MTSNPAPHPWLEHAAAYALGALDESERASFEAHFASCDICAAEVRELRDVTGVIAGGIKQVTPPPGLRDRILADARTVRPISAASQSTARASTSPTTSAPASVQAVPSAGRAVESRSAKAGRGSVLPWLAAAAAIVFAVVLGQQYRGERDARATAEQALASARLTMDSTSAALARRDSLIASLVAPDVQAVSVSGTGPSPSARYFLDRRAGRVIIAASSLPPAAKGRTYQLWGIETGRPPVGLGTFNTDANGRAVVTLTVPAGLRVAVTAVTDEPTGGSRQPTTTPFLAATWKSE